MPFQPYVALEQIEPVIPHAHTNLVLDPQAHTSFPLYPHACISLAQDSRHAHTSLAPDSPCFPSLTSLIVSVSAAPGHKDTVAILCFFNSTAMSAAIRSVCEKQD